MTRRLETRATILFEECGPGGASEATQELNQIDQRGIALSAPGVVFFDQLGLITLLGSRKAEGEY